LKLKKLKDEYPKLKHIILKFVYLFTKVIKDLES